MLIPLVIKLKLPKEFFQNWGVGNTELNRVELFLFSIFYFSFRSYQILEYCHEQRGSSRRGSGVSFS